MIPCNINHTGQIKKFETIHKKIIIIFFFFPDVFPIISVTSNQISNVSFHPKSVLIKTQEDVTTVTFKTNFSSNPDLSSVISIQEAHEVNCDVCT